MMRNPVFAALPLASPLCAAAPPAQERCLAMQYQLPASIGEEMRPYVICGLLRERDGHFSVRLNGQAVSLRGRSADSCDRIRRSAMEASEVRLAAVMPDATARRSFILDEFQKAEDFLRVAALAEDLAIGEQPDSPQCRIPDASNR